MSEQGQEDADPNFNFNVRNLYWTLFLNNKRDEAIEFLNNDRLTPQNKRAAVKYEAGIDRTTLLMRATYHDASLTLIQRLCEIGGKPLIMDTNISGWTALHNACYRDDPNIDIVKYLVQNGGMELVNKKNKEGKTALDYTKGKGNDFMLQLSQRRRITESIQRQKDPWQIE